MICLKKARSELAKDLIGFRNAGCQDMIDSCYEGERSFNMTFGKPRIPKKKAEGCGCPDCFDLEEWIKEQEEKLQGDEEYERIGKELDREIASVSNEQMDLF